MPSAAAFLPSASDLRGAAILSGAFLALLAAAELWRRFGNPQPEWTRKLVHLGGGGVCLLFPFLVESPWVVLAMALAMTALFAAGARFGGLRSLHGVERKSRGAEYYPLAIFLVFVLARSRPFLYVSAVLVLAVADAFAALVGSRYGRLRYEVEEETKSVEGSLVFLVIAFLAIHLPTLLLTDLPRGVCVLAALLVALLVTGFEAISLQGADNLFVPLAVAVVLGKITTKPLSEVIFQNVSLLAIALLVALVVRRAPSFNVGGAIVYILFAYGAWSLGNWQWALPALAGFLLYVVLWSRLAPEGHAAGIRVRTVARALLPPFLMLLLANMANLPGALYGASLAACAAVLAAALATGALRLSRLQGGARSLAAAGVALLAVAVTALPPWLVQRGDLRALAALFVVVAALAVANDLYERHHPEVERRRSWTTNRFLLACVAAVVVIGLQAAGVIAPWDPSWVPWHG